MTPESSEPRIHSAQVYCEVCGNATAHRVFRLRGGSGAAMSGTGRCSVCRTTHAFEIPVTRTLKVRRIHSAGPRTEVTLLDLPPDLELIRGELLVGREPAERIQRIDLPDGRSAQRARGREAGTVWTVPAAPEAIRVSIVEGASTRSARLPVVPGSTLAIGAIVAVDSIRLVVVGIRTHGRTMRRSDRPVPVESIDRLYVRRISSPPAGSNDWSRSRESPSAPASSTSRAFRSRSSPGRRRNRISPRDRTAAGGATDQSSRPS